MLGGCVSDVGMLLVPILLLLGDPGVVIIQPELSDTLLLAKSEILNRPGLIMKQLVPYLVFLELLHQHFVGAIYLAEFLSSILAGVGMMFLHQLDVLLSNGASARVLLQLERSKMLGILVPAPPCPLMLMTHP